MVDDELQANAAGYVFVVPSLKVSGGTLEIVKLARDLHMDGRRVAIVALWATDDPIDTGPIPVTTLCAESFGLTRTLVRWPSLMFRFRRALREFATARSRIVFSHYSTFVLMPATRAATRWFFVQDTEWRFVASGRYRTAVKRFILAALRRGRVLTTNDYLTDAMTHEDVPVAAQVAIWADAAFAGRTTGERDIDLVLMLRHGAHKRADLGVTLIDRCRTAHPSWRIAVITPERELARRIEGAAHVILVRPDKAAMRALYERCRLFVLLSDHEGFGLPPLEAMGSGCVPLCRDAGGVRSYMTASLASLLVPLAVDIDGMLDRAAALLEDVPRWSALSAASATRFRAGVATYDRRLKADAALSFTTGS